jgi:hypothetical protein
VKGNFKGSLHENVFIKETLSPAQHLYNYLYENNMLSKYDELAEYMDYPSVSELQNEMEIYDTMEAKMYDPEFHINKLGLSPEKYNIRRKELYLSPNEVEDLKDGFATSIALKNLLTKCDFQILDKPISEPSTQEKPSKTPISPSKPVERKPRPYDKPGYEKMFRSEPSAKKAFDALVKEDDEGYDEGMFIQEAIDRLINKLKSLPVGVASVEDEESDICLELDGECEEMKNFPFYTTCEYKVMQGDNQIAKLSVEMGDDDYFKTNLQVTGYEGKEEDYDVDEITEVTNMINNFLEKQNAVGLELEDITIPNAEGFENTDVTVEKDGVRADTMYFKFKDLPVDFLYEILSKLVDKFDNEEESKSKSEFTQMYESEKKKHYEKGFDALLKEEDNKRYENVRIQDALDRLVNKLKRLPTGVKSVEDEESDVYLELNGECEEMKSPPFHTICKYKIMQGDIKVALLNVEIGDDNYFKTKLYTTTYNPNVSMRCGKSGCEFYNKHNKLSGCYNFDDRRDCSISMKQRRKAKSKSKRGSNTNWYGI